MTTTIEWALLRFYGTTGYTAGKLYSNGDFVCYTLEDEVREINAIPVPEWKISGVTAIPRGRYEVKITMSPKFGRELPILLGVRGFTGVRLHRGNKAAHTAGCPLLGMSDGNDRDSWLGNSAPAEEKVIALLREQLNKGNRVFLTIV